jgi:hypothetical protein
MRPNSARVHHINSNKEKDTIMSADSSKFSFKEVTELLKPHIKRLQFSPLNSQLLNTRIVTVGQKSVQCKILLEHIVAPITLGEDRMVQVLDLEHLTPTDSRVANMFLQYLIAERISGGGDTIHWYYMEVPVRYPNEPWIRLESIPTVRIIPFDQELEAHLRRYKMPLFDIFALKAIEGWVSASIETRKHIVEQLTPLWVTCQAAHSQCVFKDKQVRRMSL